VRNEINNGYLSSSTDSRFFYQRFIRDQYYVLESTQLIGTGFWYWTKHCLKRPVIYCLCRIYKLHITCSGCLSSATDFSFGETLSIDTQKDFIDFAYKVHITLTSLIKIDQFGFNMHFSLQYFRMCKCCLKNS